MCPMFLTYDTALMTISITAISFAVGQLFGLLLAIALRAPAPVSWLAHCYAFVVRGTPLLVQLFIVYYGLPRVPGVKDSIFWPVIKYPLGCAILCIGLNSAAYVAVFIRGVIDMLPKGQVEASRMLGLHRLQIYWLVVLPQVYRTALPIVASEFILVMKASALASVITVMDVTGAARTLVARTYAPFETFAQASVVYLVFGLLASLLFRRLENHLSNKPRPSRNLGTVSSDKGRAW